eukprot:1161794-Pelagomonas_calceolata.AAC.4
MLIDGLATVMQNWEDHGKGNKSSEGGIRLALIYESHLGLPILVGSHREEGAHAGMLESMLRA